MIEKIRTFILQLDLFTKPDILLVVAIIFVLLVIASSLFFVWGKVKPQANLAELKSRTNSWWVMVVFFVFSALLDREISFPAIGLLSFIAFRELYSILDFRDSDRRAIFWAILAIPIQYYLAYIGWYMLFIIFIPVNMFLFIPVRLVIKGETKGIIKSMASMQWALMLTVFGISHLAYFLSLPVDTPNFKNGGQGLLLFLVLLLKLMMYYNLFGANYWVSIKSPQV